jgi:hypothetical protein
MDNCPGDLTSEVLDVLTMAQVRIVAFAPHTTHIFQLLDLRLFVPFRRVGKHHLPFNDLRSTSRFIYGLYMHFKKALIPASIWATFGGIGVEFGRATVPYRVIFVSEKLRESKGSKEFWAIDFRLDALPTQRRSCRFDWLNKPD